MKLDNYRTIIFDCDGVVLNSNRIKTDAFHRVASRFGKVHADNLVEYHTKNGGVSRYLKFEWFLTDQLQLDPQNQEVLLNELVGQYAEQVRAALVNAEAADKLKELRDATSGSGWMIVSGGDQAELRDVFTARGEICLFDKGIFGSPDNKVDIFQREMSRGGILEPAIFIGDSRYDHVAAKEAGLDFIFVKEWSEFKDINEYAEINDVETLMRLSDLLGGQLHENC